MSSRQGRRLIIHVRNEVINQSFMTGKRINEIDLLRFLAALSVVFFHYAFRGYAADDMTIMPYPPLANIAKYGYLGVDFFFMISGFVILMTVADGSFRNFFISRVVRLYPAFWVCCTITFIVTKLFGAPRYVATTTQYLINMTMLSGPAHVSAIDGVYWTLIVELTFYALVAAVLAVGRLRQIQHFLLLWIIVSALLEVLPVRTLRHILIVNYSAYFIAGAAYFIAWRRGFSPARVGIIASCWVLSLCQSIGDLPRFEDHYSTRMNPYIVAVLVSTFYLIMWLVATNRFGAIARRRWYVAGAITYPLYLLHQNIGFIVFNMAYPSISPHILLWGMICAMLLLSYIVHCVFEKPMSSQLKTILNRVFDAVRPPALLKSPIEAQSSRTSPHAPTLSKIK